MADGYLEKHHEDYEARKAAWLRRFERPRKTGARRKPGGTIERPDDEAL